MGIKHIEDLKPNELLNFLSNWNLDKSKYKITEKVDGNFFAFGVNHNNGFYIRSKNKTFSSADDIPNLFFLNDFRKYFTLLENIPLQKIMFKLQKKYKGTPFEFEFNGNIEIQGEAIPSYDHNIVLYDQEKIGDGVFVMFGLVIENNQNEKIKNIDSENLWNDLVNEIDAHTPIKFYKVPEVDPGLLNDISNELVVSLKAIIDEHGNILAKPARKPEHKKIKQELLSKIKEIGSSAKQELLQSKLISRFGEEYEGFVIVTPDGKQAVKLVDKNKFTKRKEQNWFFIDQLIRAQNNFKKIVKSDPGKLEQQLKEWYEELLEIEKDFIKNKDEYFTIPKKIEDTRKSIELDKKTIEKMLELTTTISPEEIVDLYLNKKIIYENMFFETIGRLYEGGNVFSIVNSHVPKEVLKANVEMALNKLGLDDLNYKIVGNVNKKFLGDVDVALEHEELAKSIQNTGDFWKDLETHLISIADNDLDFVINKGLRQFHISMPLISKDKSKQLPAYDAEGNVIEDKGVIQIDFFIGALKWMEKTSSGAPKESSYKAVYRNLLLASIFATVKWHSRRNPNTFYKISLNQREGLKLSKRQIVFSKNKEKIKTLKNEVVSIDPDTVTKILFGKNVYWEDINSFEKLWNLYNSNKFRFPNEREKINKEFEKTLIRNKHDVPNELTNNKEK